MMLRQITMGLLAGALAILVITIARPINPIPKPLDHGWNTLETAIPTIVSTQPITRPRSSIETRLDTVIAKVELQNARLEDAFNYLRKITQANIEVDWKAFAKYEINGDTKINVELNDVTVRRILKSVLREAGLHIGYRIDENVITVSFDDQLAYKLETRVYDIRDLIGENGPFAGRATNGPDSADDRPPDAGRWPRIQNLAAFVQTEIGPTAWQENGGSQGSIHFLSGHLFIKQTPEAHREIEEILAKIRST